MATQSGGGTLRFPKPNGVLDAILGIVCPARRAENGGELSDPTLVEVQVRRKQNSAAESPSVRFCRIDCTSPEDVAAFISWLYHGEPETALAFDAPMRPLTESEMVELTWGDQAPRRRAAILLWQLLVGSSEQSFYQSNFTYNPRRLANDASRCAELLPPIQLRLRQVIDGLMKRLELDRDIGQGGWGESWWLPEDLAQRVRQQLGRAIPTLLEQASDYEDCLLLTRKPYTDPPSEDPGRVYVGSYDDQSVGRVHIETTAGERFALPNALRPFQSQGGRGYAWGYGGGGPGELARDLLADALGGDIDIADSLRAKFVEEVISEFELHGPFSMKHGEVMRWLGKHSVGATVLAASRRATQELRRRHAPRILDAEARISRICALGGLRAQRFDLVPPDFECALHLDLMKVFERSDFVITCSQCSLPISCSNDKRSNHQLARWRSGLPIYHDDCAADRTRARNRAYHKARSSSAKFREGERQRARTYRREVAALAPGKRPRKIG